MLFAIAADVFRHGAAAMHPSYDAMPFAAVAARYAMPAPDATTLLRASAAFAYFRHAAAVFRG